MDREKDAGETPQPQGFEALLKQNEIAEAQAQAGKQKETIEERIRQDAPERPQSVVRNIRTLKGDLEESIALGKTTIVGIASAEARAAIGTQGTNVIVSSIRVKKAKKIALYVLGFLLIGAGIGGLWYVIELRREGSVVKIERVESFVSVEKIETVDATSLSGEDLKKELMRKRDATEAQIGTLVGFIATKKVVTEDRGTETVLLSAEEFLRAIAIGAPSRLVRTLDPEFLYGIHIFDGNQPFLVFKTTSYESAFSAMLEWERTAEKTVGLFMRVPSDFASVGTTTDAVGSRGWSDIIYKNIDARALKNEAGKILVVYAFPTRDTLIITTGAETIGEIFSRLVGRRVVR